MRKSWFNFVYFLSGKRENGAKRSWVSHFKASFEETALQPAHKQDERKKRESLRAGKCCHITLSSHFMLRRPQLAAWDHTSRIAFGGVPLVTCYTLTYSIFRLYRNLSVLLLPLLLLKCCSWVHWQLSIGKRRKRRAMRLPRKEPSAALVKFSLAARLQWVARWRMPSSAERNKKLVSHL